MGEGMGFFSAPNTSQIVGAVPVEQRRSAAGMRAMVLNAGLTASQAIFFTIVIASLSPEPWTGVGGRCWPGRPARSACAWDRIPTAGAAIFAALLGYDPISHLIPASLFAALPRAIAARVGDPHFFAGLLAQPFVMGIRVALLACVAMCVLAGVTSALRGSDRQRHMAVQPPVGDLAVVGEPMAPTR